MQIDNFALELYETCPRKYLQRIALGFVPMRKSPALHFGGCFHSGLAEWYRTEDVEKACMAIVAAWGSFDSGDDYRTLERCMTVMVEYTREYPADNFSVVGAPDTPLIECAFTLDTELGFSYGGIIDGVVERMGEIYVLEHKTTSQLGGTFFGQFKPNNQISGYCWAAAKLSNKPVAGAIVNAIGVLKTQTKFERQLVTRSQADLAEWMKDVSHAVAEIQRAQAEGYWRKRTVSCVTKYGDCMFKQVCALSHDKLRASMLSQDFNVQPWSHEERDNG